MPIEGTPSEDGSRCVECDTAGATNNRVRVYDTPTHARLSGSAWLGAPPTITLCTRCFNREYTSCHECDGVLLRSATYDDGYCRFHRMGCSEGCGERGVFANGVCNDCGWWCEGCDNVWPESVDRYWIDEESYCPSCYAENREELSPDEESWGVRGYGHTYPAKWFGGPLPRDEQGRRVGYYLGFELEVSAEREDARMLHRWADDNNLSGFLDCKQDSSVEGFEIATQPFTPEYFERLMADGRLASFFEVLNKAHPIRGQESEHHGLHVHIGRVAFHRDPVALAAFSYLLAQDGGKHLERIARRSPTGYCSRVDKPVSAAVVSLKQRGLGSAQSRRLYGAGLYPGRNAVNLTNGATVEIRAFRSTRSVEELAAAVRLVYVAAEYVRYLRRTSKTTGLDPKLLSWAEFCRWAAFAHPEAFPSLVGLETVKKVRVTQRPVSGEDEEFTFNEDDDDLFSTEVSGLQAALREQARAEALARHSRRVNATVTSGVGLTINEVDFDLERF